MAELAAGAVSSLLGVLRKEALLLGRIGHDVEFIREEMESMNSFLEHLARTTPPGGEHDEQVRTWMKQVRDLAHDCSNCIDRYLQRGDLGIHRARGGLRRYAWWAYWLVQEMLAQHAAAVRLRELKERARDVGKRRMRYGVQLPSESAGVLTGRGDDDDNVHTQQATAVAGDSSDSRREALEPCALEDYCTRKLVEWFDQQAKTTKTNGVAAPPSISIVVPDAVRGRTIADEAQSLAKDYSFERSVPVDLPNGKIDLPLFTNELLCYILRECEGDNRSYIDHRGPVLDDMRTKARGYDLYSKISKIVAKVGDIEKMEAGKSTEQAGDEIKSAVSSKEPMGVILQALWPLINKEGQPPSKQDLEELTSSEKVVKKTAKMLKEYIEKEYKDGGVSPIHLEVSQYEDILRDAYPNNPGSGTKPEEDHGSSAASATTATSKQVTYNHKITLEIIRDLPPPEPQQQQQPSGSAANVEQQAGDGKDQSKEGEPSQKSSPEEKKRTRLVIKGTVDMVTLGGVKEEGSSSNEDPSAKKEASTGTLGAEVASAIKAAKGILWTIRWPIWAQLVNTGIVDKIKGKVKREKTLIIVQDEEDYVSWQWEETRKALGLLGSSFAVMIFTTNNQKAKEYCHPPREPITCSLVGFYHDTVLQLMNLQQQEAHVENEEEEDGSRNKYSKILRDILDKCDPHEFCMKMFAHALYANPNRSREELQRLHDALQQSNKSLATNAKNIIKFSYRDLPREHKTCLLYLAIFPQGHKISRSVLIGRWLTEGLITKEDWPTAVRHAEQCFDGLVDRWLLWPSDIGASGKVKSCILDDRVHGFITKAAKKQHILDGRLSYFWAHHFSLYSGLRLRASDSIEKFVKKLPNHSPQLPSLKLLDLQGCLCLENNQRYLKDICNKIFLLKYLSLRGTNITHLPSEINNLHELEVLDIRQTRVLPERDTRDIVLLKLRRLLAGHVDPKTSSHDKLARGDDMFSYVLIPHKIEKMENMEVLSKVKASSKGSELKDIRKLWQLRKLGVVIDDNEDHLKNFLRAISDLSDCLQSLSIILPETTSQNADPNSKFIGDNIYHRLIQTPKLLESLSINGFTKRIRLLSVLAKGSNELAKVTLTRTLLEEKNLAILAELPKLRCVRLRHNAYDEEELTFKKNDYMHLMYFLVEGANTSDNGKGMTKETAVNFEDEAAPELEKIVLSYSNIRSVCGIGRLKKLKELELTCNKFLLSFSNDDGAAQKKSSDSGSPNQNTQEGAPQQNTQVDGAPVQDTRSSAMEQSTEQEAVVENTQSKTTIIEDTDESKTPEQDTNKSSFIFKAKEFEHLKYFLLVEDSKITNIIFQEGAAPKLEKIVLSLSNEKSEITGGENLSKLKEVELKGGKFLLKSFLKADHIAKVTLRDTQLKKDDLKDLASKPNLRCLVLSENSFEESQISFDKNEFPKLELLKITDCSKINSLSFTDGSAPNLEKIDWSFKEMKSLSGINHLPKLQELEFIGETVPRQKCCNPAELPAHH
nr:unnamed protein product [Digitaria exilis]